MEGECGPSLSLKGVLRLSENSPPLLSSEDNLGQLPPIEREFCTLCWAGYPGKQTQHTGALEDFKSRGRSCVKTRIPGRGALCSAQRRFRQDTIQGTLSWGGEGKWASKQGKEYDQRWTTVEPFQGLVGSRILPKLKYIWRYTVITRSYN